jgi:protein ImuB
MTLADARALVPGLEVAEADPEADRAALGKFAEWCTLYTPWTATDGEDGLILNITGCAHLFGGEESLVSDLTLRLKRLGYTTRAAVGDTLGAAWAWAHFGEGGIVAPGHTRTALKSLPIAALRLPVETVDRLERLGLKRISDLIDMPRAPLAARFGDLLLRRLDQALGLEDEPISPREPVTPWRSRIAFAEPIGRLEDLQRGVRGLLDELCTLLKAPKLGARRLELRLYRVDGTTQRFAVGTSRPVRDPAHLMRLFSERLEEADPGFGIEVMVLGATDTERFREDQLDLESQKAGAEEELARLIDRLQNRLGARSIVRAAPFDSHIPERAVTVVPATAPPGSADWMAEQPRPVRLLPSPEPIEAVAPVPDDPPLSFRWRRVHHRVTKAEGPERIAPEWWRRGETKRSRDYYWIEDTEGRRFWVYRDGAYQPDKTPRWYLHGLFA